MKTSPVKPVSTEAQIDGLRLVNRIMSERFAAHHTPRSAPYKAGVRSLLQLRLCGVDTRAMPYPVGSAEADAYFAGQNEGKQLAAVSTRISEGGAA